jgi:hypothetical protein
MGHRQFAILSLLICLTTGAVDAQGQSKPAAKSITVYKTPT